MLQFPIETHINIVSHLCSFLVTDDKSILSFDIWCPPYYTTAAFVLHLLLGFQTRQLRVVAQALDSKYVMCIELQDISRFY